MVFRETHMAAQGQGNGTRIASRRGWRVSAGLSLLLASAVLAVMFGIAWPGGSPAAAGPLNDLPVPDSIVSSMNAHGGALAVNLPQTTNGAALDSSSETSSGLIEQEIAIQFIRGPCEDCSFADPLFDPDMGRFLVSFSAPVSDEGFGFCRAPCQNEVMSIDPMPGPYSALYLWFHRPKGCGVFMLWGTSGGTINTNSVPVYIPCTGSLVGDTVAPRWGDYGSGLFPPYPFDPAASNQTMYSNGPGSVTISARNRTVTTMRGRYHASAVTFNGIPIDPPPISPSSDLPLVIPPGGSADFPFIIQNDWSEGAQEVRVATASPVQITATLVFSFGPTARMTQTLILARPDTVYEP